MSMISGLIDELNKSADEWNGSNMFELARMCRDAADTIWQLRDDLQRTNDAVRDAEHDKSRAWDRVRKAEAENAKLRNEVDNLLDFEHLTSVAVAYAGCDECGEYKQTMLRLFAENAKLRYDLEEANNQAEEVCIENAKLRELVSGLEYCVQGYVCDCCPLYDPSCTNHHRCESLERELGIEADDGTE